MEEEYYYVVIQTSKVKYDTVCNSTPFMHMIYNDMHLSDRRSHIVYSEKITRGQYDEFQRHNNYGTRILLTLDK